MYFFIIAELVEEALDVLDHSVGVGELEKHLVDQLLLEEGTDF